MSDDMFEGRPDYEIPLLMLLADMPDGGGRQAEVWEQFERRYGKRIPADHHDMLDDNRTTRWQKHVAFIRMQLNKQGLINSPAYGVWRISDAGRAWLRENPQATRVTGTTGRRSVLRTKEQRESPQRGDSSTQGVSLAQLELVRKQLPDAEFQNIFGEAYARLVADERAKVTTHLDDRALLTAAKQQAQRIQDFLQGRSQSRPGSEELCDWILFCYWFGLHREAVALWSLVNPDELEPHQAERIKKIVAVCKTKLS